MTVLGYFPQRAGPATVPLVCPACGRSFPVALHVLRSAKNVGCPSCRHVRPAPSLPASVEGLKRAERVSEFPHGP